MSSFARHGLNWNAVTRSSLLAAGFICAAALAGCSADLGRFDSVSLNGDGPRSRQAPIPHEPLRRNAGAPVGAMEPDPPLLPSPGPAPVRQSGLPEPVYRDPEPRRPIEQPRGEAARPGRALPGAAAATERAPASGTSIEVQQGDTLYGLGRQHKVAISELMRVNNLQNPTIRPGQRLVLPAGGRRAVPPRRNEAVAGAPAGTPSRIASAAPTAATLPPASVSEPVSPPPSDWNGTHTVSPRDSLYVIARQHKVKVAELQSVNGITDPSKLRAGTVLKVPGSGAGAASGEAARVVTPQAPAHASQPSAHKLSAPSAATPAGGPRIINSGARTEMSERVAAVTPRTPSATDPTPDAAPAARDAQAKPASAAAGSGKFRWPAKGKVVANFGPRSDNTHNDGINILVPQGTDVLAAEGGTVAYAGSELKGYGNLLLIRHEGNWVTAYAHNETLMVKRGDKVSRGQAIAKAGKTGAVDQPQVHFELRQGSKPIDPMPHLER